MFPEERYDWMRQKDGDYEIENTLCFSHHGAMLFIGERIKGLSRVIHAKDKKALLDKELAAKKKLDDKNTLQARAHCKFQRQILIKKKTANFSQLKKSDFCFLRSQKLAHRITFLKDGAFKRHSLSESFPIRPAATFLEHFNIFFLAKNHLSWGDV